MEQAVQTKWYAARTRYGQERKIHERLDREGVEHFIPVNNLVFLRTTKTDALELANMKALPVRYIIDCATRTLLVVPDKQMEDFRRVLDLSLESGGLVDKPLSLGDWVRVTKGPLKGVEGRVLELQGRLYVVVGLMDCLFAKARVPRSWIEKCEK
ncbi:MAG: UpxY family transcription antiterminator [Bacteroidales bacterium]|nr:UpxY family transcription antiterminator [Bacteroidales bacterium]